MRIEINKPFFLQKHKDVISEGCRMLPNESFFDLIIYSNQAKKDAKELTKKKIKYGVFSKNGALFFLLDFVNYMTFDAAFNLLKLGTVTDVEPQHDTNRIGDWLEADANVITVFVVDLKSNYLRYMRLFAIKNDVAKEFKIEASKQLELSQKFGVLAMSKVEENNYNAMHRYSTEQMIEQSKMHYL